MKAYIYHPIEDGYGGYFVGECLGLCFYESAVGNDLSPDEKPIEFPTVSEAIDYVRSWIASDGKDFVTTDPPPGPPTTIVYQAPFVEMPRELLE